MSGVFCVLIFVIFNYIKYKKNAELNHNLPMTIIISGDGSGYGNVDTKIDSKHYTVIAAKKNGMVAIPYVSSNSLTWIIKIRTVTDFSVVTGKVDNIEVTYIPKL